MAGPEEWKKWYSEDEKKISKRTIILILMIAAIAASMLLAYLLFVIKIEIPGLAKRIDVGLNFTADDVTYNPVSAEEKEFLNRNNTRSFMSLVEKISGTDWPTFIQNPLDDGSTKKKAVLLLCGQAQITGFYTSIVWDEIGNSEIASLDINELDENNVSKENLLQAINNLKNLEEFYFSKGLQLAETSANRYAFAYNYFSKVDLPRNDTTTHIDCGETYGGSIKLIIRSYNLHYKVMTSNA